jgi:hypothetical protein
MRDGEAFQSCNQLQQPSQLGMFELAHCRAGAERLESVCPSFYARYLDADVLIRLHSTYRLWYNLDMPYISVRIT